MADLGGPPVSRAADEAAQVEQIRQWLEAAIRSEANADASDRCEHYDVLVDSRSSLADLRAALAASQQARQQAEQARDELKQLVDERLELSLDALDALRTAKEAAEARVIALEQKVIRLGRAVDGHQHAETIKRVIGMIEAGYEVSDVGPDNGGFQTKLENYIHQIWKREPKVADLVGQLTALKQERDALAETVANCSDAIAEYCSKNGDADYQGVSLSGCVQQITADIDQARLERATAEQQCADAERFANQRSTEAEQAEAVAQRKIEECDLLWNMVAKIQAERDQYQTLAKIGVWHNECRLNRHQAAQELQKSQAVIDKLADRIAELEASKAQAEARVRALEQERDALLRDRHQPGRVSPCGHYRVFAMPCVREDGSEAPSCMQCDRDAAQDRAEKAEAQLTAQGTTLARLREALTKAKPHCGLCKGRGWRTITYDEYGMGDPKRVPCENCARIAAALAAAAAPQEEQP